MLQAMHLCKKKKSPAELAAWSEAAGGPDRACRLCLPQVWTKWDEQPSHFRTVGLTCTDSDSTNKLLSPATAPHHQGQVSLLYQLVHCVLPHKDKDKELQKATRWSACPSFPNEQNKQLQSGFIFLNIILHRLFTCCCCCTVFKKGVKLSRCLL